jgi:hypothetical protein
MEKLVEKSVHKINQIPLDFVRSMMDKIQWDYRFIGILFI